jgi:hypothetical protein
VVAINQIFPHDLAAKLHIYLILQKRKFNFLLIDEKLLPTIFLLFAWKAPVIGVLQQSRKYYCEDPYPHR